MLPRGGGAFSGSLAQSRLVPPVGSTACRAPGVVQTIPLHELAMEAAAEAVGLPADAVREANLYATGDAALCGVTVGENGFNWNLPAMWQSAKARWEVAARREQAGALKPRPNLLQSH